jgi:hypothetical protein
LARRRVSAELAALFRAGADIRWRDLDFSAESVIPSWNPSCLPVAMPLEIVTGRALAFCVHPLSAWHRLPASGRVLLVAAYVSASYAIVLLTLFIV